MRYKNRSFWCQIKDTKPYSTEAVVIRCFLLIDLIKFTLDYNILILPQILLLVLHTYLQITPLKLLGLGSDNMQKFNIVNLINPNMHKINNLIFTIINE